MNSEENNDTLANEKSTDELESSSDERKESEELHTNEKRNWQSLISIWSGLENIRQVLSSFELTGLSNINAHYLERSFPEHKFELVISHRDQLLQALKEHDEQTKEVELDENVKLEISEARKWLEQLGEEISINKQNDEFFYSIVLKEDEDKENIAGFVRIESKEDPSHKALLSWQDAKNPILFLAELRLGKMYFHVNYGKEGLAIIQETPEGYLWTHTQKFEYIELVKAQYGSVSMNQKADSASIKLVDGNIAAAKALSHAKMKGSNGKTLFENNVTLMDMYKKDLRNLFLQA